LTPEQVEQLLDSLSNDKPAAIRSLAVVSCLSKLGLRAGEVARLRLDDINWRTGTLLLPKTKCRRPRHLPLSAEVGKALARYLRDGRPVSTHREVFLSLLAPPHPLSSQTITELTARVLRQAGIRCVRPGAHLLRHTFATQLIQRGASLKALADLLGHRQLDTTVLYAKVNLPMLREVAQPWPEVVV
jgi:site-specific recombinase XerD